MSTLNISDTDYQQIITCLGWPIVNTDEWGLTETQIKDLFILRTLQDNYFKWFPLVTEAEYSVSANFAIDFPDDNTFGIVDGRLVWKRASYDASSRSNPFVYGMAINVKASGMGKSANMWDTGNDYGFAQVYESERAYSQSVINNEKAIKKRVDYNNRQLVGFTNMAGKIVVQWAKYSVNFSDIPHKFKDDVYKLSQARLLEYFGRLLNKGTGSLPTELAGDDLIDEAEGLREGVMEKWKGYTKVVMMR